MKFLITSDCLRSGGRFVAAGTVLTDTTEDERRDLLLADRGRTVPDETSAPETSAPKAKK